MYYLVLGVDDGSFEWVIEADSIESARQNAMKDLGSADKITSIKKLSINECIELGYKELSNEIKRYYFESHYNLKNIAAKGYLKIDEQLGEELDGYYKALKEFNKKLRLLRLLNRVADVDDMKLGELKKCMNSLSQAKTEEEFNEILNEAKEN